MITSTMDPTTFAYHQGNDDQVEAVKDLQKAYNRLLIVIECCVPSGRYRSEAVMELEKSGAMAVKGVFKNDNGSQRTPGESGYSIACSGLGTEKASCDVKKGE
jgi:hypothetical protein